MKFFCLLLGLIFGAANICSAQTTTVFDVLVATETLTVVGTTTLQGNSFNIGGSSFVVSQGKVGVATSTPVGLFTVGNGTITVVNSGFVGIGTTTPSALLHVVGVPISGTGAQFKWIASSASLRVGEVSGKAWDNAGLFSMAFGLDNEAKGYYSSVSGGQLNTTASSFSVIGGGYNNSISSGINSAGYYTVICGGALNDSRYFALYGFAGGGVNNSLQKEGAAIASGYSNVAKGFYSFIGGGHSNTTDGIDSVVVGGGSNALASCDYCSIGGGGGNNATGAAGAVIAGGGVNSSLLNIGNVAGGISASVLGGVQNTATGDFSATLGGLGNRATASYSVAAGLKANSAAKGSFVWADSQNSDVTSTTADEFRTRAGGGYVLLSTPTAATIIVSSGAIIISTSATAASAVPNIFISSINGNVGINTMRPATTLDVNGSAQFGSGATKSTFTTTGNLTLDGAASLTGSSATFSASGSNIYSLTASSGIHILAGGITWPDGTTSTTSAASGAGATGTGWIVQSTAVFTGATSYTFSNLASSTTYELVWSCTQRSANGKYHVRFNSDSASNYKWVWNQWNDYNGAQDHINSFSGTEIPITSTVDSVLADDSAFGKVTFLMPEGYPKRVRTIVTTEHTTASSIGVRFDGEGQYGGSSNFSSVTLAVTAGTMDCKLRLMNLP